MTYQLPLMKALHFLETLGYVKVSAAEDHNRLANEVL
jgi:hypothetical protein